MKIDHLTQIRTALSAVLTAECSALARCSCNPVCPIPFAELDPHADAPRSGTEPQVRPEPPG